MRYGMLIDLKRCMGCGKCAVDCKIVNNLPKDTWWNVVHTEGAGNSFDMPAGEWPDSLKMSFIPLACQHCAAPACVTVCPTGATYKREEDGIVMTNYDECIGCKLCNDACPYAVRVFYDQEPTYYMDFALGDADADVHTVNTSAKCNFCYKRLDRGEVPACMELCPVKARSYGDLDDPNSDLAKKMAGREVMLLKEEEGTGPSTTYLL